MASYSYTDSYIDSYADSYARDHRMCNALHVLTKHYGGSVDIRTEHRYDSYIDNYVNYQASKEHLAS